MSIAIDATKYENMAHVIPYLIRNPGGVACLDSHLRGNDKVAIFIVMSGVALNFGVLFTLIEIE